MRIRRNPKALHHVGQLPGVLEAQPETLKGKWQEIFGGEGPLYVEIGMGKGDFLLGMAREYPHIHFLGIEKVPEVMYIAAKKNRREPLHNVRYMMIDAEHLTDFFVEGEVARIFLNFSDPWPKNRHARRRLTHPDMLKRYKAILAQEGEIHLKTDQEALFDFSVSSFLGEGFSVVKVTRDLHADNPEDNVMTEYERRFAQLGHPIYRCEAHYGRS